MQILISILVGMFISIAIYIKKWQSQQQPWIWQKFVFTTAVGVVVGIVAQMKGVTPQNITEEYLVAVCATYAGIITILQTVIQIIWNLFKKKGK